MATTAALLADLRPLAEQLTADPLVEVLHPIIADLRAYDTKLDSSVTRSSNELQVVLREAKSAIGHVSAEVARMPARRFILDLQRDIDITQDERLHTVAPIADAARWYQKSLHALALAFDEWHKERGENDAVTFARAGAEAVSSHRSLSSALNAVVESLRPSWDDTHSDESELQLIFDGATSAHVVSEHLEALSRAYDAIARFLGPDVAEDGVEIIRVERGSLLLWVKGKAAVIGLLRGALLTLMRIVSTNYTPRARAEIMAMRVGVLNAFLQARPEIEALRAQPATSSLEDTIVKMADALAEDASRLFEQCPLVQVDGQRVVPLPSTQLRLPFRGPRLLVSGDAKEADETRSTDADSEGDEDGDEK